MKIFILVHNLTNGGAERVASLWATGFSAENEVCVIINDNKNPITYKVPNNVRILNIASNKSSRLKRYIDGINKLRIIISKNRPDLIIGVLSSRVKWAKLFATFYGIPVINTEHNAFERPDSAPLSRSTYWNKFFLNKIYDGITVLTNADKIVIKNRLNKVKVLPNPCTFTPALTDIIEKKEKIILASGRLTVWHCKGFDILLKAWSLAINEVDKEWKLVITGQGNEESEEYLKNLTDELGITDRVKFVGYISSIQPWYERSSIFVLSSRYEGFGMVLLEAMSQGCACIACDYKGRQKEILGEPPAGVVVRPEDELRLRDAIVRVCNDNVYRKTIQVQGIERSKLFSLNNIMDKWNKIITDFIKS